MLLCGTLGGGVVSYFHACRGYSASRFGPQLRRRSGSPSLFRPQSLVPWQLFARRARIGKPFSGLFTASPITTAAVLEQLVFCRA